MGSEPGLLLDRAADGLTDTGALAVYDPLFAIIPFEVKMLGKLRFGPLHDVFGQRLGIAQVDGLDATVGRAAHPLRFFDPAWQLALEFLLQLRRDMQSPVDVRVTGRIFEGVGIDGTRFHNVGLRLADVIQPVTIAMPDVGKYRRR